MNFIKLVTAYDTKYEVGQLASLTHELYCTVHSLDYEKFIIEDFERPPAWYKIKVILEELTKNDHEYILWVDADAFFVDFNFDLKYQINNGLIDIRKSIHLTSHYISDIATQFPLVRAAKLRINSGVILVKNCDESRNILRNVWEQKQFINHAWWEQAALMHIIGHNCELNGNDMSTNKPDDFYEKIIGRLPAYMNCMPSPDENYHTEVLNPVIVHFAGIPNRINHAKALIKNFKTIPPDRSIGIHSKTFL